MASQNQRQRLALCAAAALVCCLAACRARPAEPLRAAIIRGPVGDAFEAVANRSGWRIQVTRLSYGELLQSARTAVDKRAPDDRFDVVMIDDPWLPALNHNGDTAGLAGLDGVPIQPWMHPHCLTLCLDAGGQRLAVPFLANVQVLFYHAELLDAAPASWNDVLTRAAEAERVHRVQGFAIRGAEGHAIVADFLPLLWAHGGDLDPSSGLTGTEALEALRFLLKLAEHAAPGYTGFGADELRAQFGQSQAAIALGWLASAGILHDSREMIPLPPIEEGKPAGPAVLSTWLLAVPRAADQRRRDEVKRFLTALLSKDALGETVISCGGLPVLNSGRLPCGRLRNLAIRPRPRTRRWLEIEERLSFYLSAAATGQLAPEDAMDRAASEIEAITAGQPLTAVR